MNSSGCEYIYFYFAQPELPFILHSVPNERHPALRRSATVTLSASQNTRLRLITNLYGIGLFPTEHLNTILIHSATQVLHFVFTVSVCQGEEKTMATRSIDRHYYQANTGHRQK